MRMLEKNADVMSRLANMIKQTETTRSSHWQECLEDYYFDGVEFSGLAGFGQETPRNPFLQYVHTALQVPFRKRTKCDPHILRMGRALARRQGRIFDLDQLRQVLTLSSISEQLDIRALDGYTVVIGDGFANFTNLLLATMPDHPIIIVNLTPVLLVDASHVLGANPEIELTLPENEHEMREACTLGRSPILLQADKFSLLEHLNIALVINIASFQEMEPWVINQYFDLVRSSTFEKPYLYCCNRTEKRMSDGTMTRFAEYPWNSRDEILVDELCPWHQKYYMIRPPRYLAYASPVQHRLVRLANSL